MTVAFKLLNKSLFFLVLLSAALWIAGCSGGGENEPAAEVEQDVTFTQGMKSATEASDQKYREVAEPQALMAPDFELPRLEGGTFRLSDYEGYIVLLDFWATWCGPCRMAIPHLIKVHEAFKGEKVVVVGIALDRGGRPVVEKFVDEFKIPYPIIMGDANVVAKYGNFQNIPVTFLINARGEVVSRHVGFRPRQVYESGIRALLEETEAPG